jgi:PAS domain S-box-containing protein
MFSAIREYFTPPVFRDDEEKTSTARILFLALKFYFSFSILMLLGDVFIFVRKLQILLVVLLFIIILSIAKSLAHNGKIRPAGYLIVIFLWCLYTPAIWLSGGVVSLIAVSYIIISIMSGLLLGRQASISVAAISCFTLLVMYLLESSGIYAPKYFPFPLQSVLFLWLLSFIIIIPMINLAIQILREALVFKRKEVDERNLVEAALRESENKYRTIFENVQDVFYRVDLDGIILELSPSIIQYSGYSREELIGKPVEMVYYNPADRIEFIQKIMDKGILTDTELSLKDKQGNPRITSASAHKYFDSNGILVGIEGSLRDITERKKIEAALVESEEKMRMIIEGTSYLFFYTQDTNANVTYVSPSVEKITGHTVEQWRSQKHWYTTDSEINNYARNKTHAHLRGEVDNETILLEITHADGHNLFLEVYETPVFKNNKVVGLHGIAHDITDRKKAEDSLKENETLLIAARDKAEEMNRLKTSILNNMSHELRTPLIGIMGFADILEAEIKDPFLLDMVTMISTSGRRLSDTLNMILDLSKMEAEQLKIIYNDINISEVTRHIIANYEGAAKVKELTLETIIKDDNINVKTDERLYSQVLDNLVNNAIKFTNIGGIRVVLDKEIISVESETKYLAILKVIDTGIGIAPEDFNLIFEEYRQVSTGLSRSFQGTGLGLTITKRFVEILGGEITVESKLGTGTTFTVKLPMSV